MLPKNIIIVEDEIMTQHFLQEILSNHSINITACLDNATDTLKVFQELPCDMILMDLDISGSTDGLTLARKLLIKRKIPIVFITAYSDNETRQEALDLSSYGFIAKPFTTKELLSTIQEGYNRFQITYSKKSIPTELLLNNEYKFLFTTNILYHKDKIVPLSQKEQKLLSILVKNYQKVVSSETITKELWGDKETTNSNLRNFIYKLRKNTPGLSINSSYNSGYILL